MSWKAMKSYLNPKAIKKKSPLGGFGVFCAAKIKKGELVADFSHGSGKIINDEMADRLYEQGKDYMLQIDDNKYFAATTDIELEDVDFINHSCNPNCGIKDSLKIVAMEDIMPKEEITFDYAMSESSPYEINCQCRQPNCRHRITGDDWKIKDLQEQYKGFFSDYLQRKIDNLNILMRYS